MGASRDPANVNVMSSGVIKHIATKIRCNWIPNGEIGKNCFKRLLLLAYLKISLKYSIFLMIRSKTIYTNTNSRPYTKTRLYALCFEHSFRSFIGTIPPFFWRNQMLQAIVAYVLEYSGISSAGWTKWSSRPHCCLVPSKVEQNYFWSKL